MRPTLSIPKVWLSPVWLTVERSYFVLMATPSIVIGELGLMSNEGGTLIVWARRTVLNRVDQRRARAVAIVAIAVGVCNVDFVRRFERSIR